MENLYIGLGLMFALLGLGGMIYFILKGVNLFEE